MQSIYEVYSYLVSIAFIISAGFLIDLLGRRPLALLSYLIGSISPLSVAILPPSLGFPVSIVLYNTFFSLAVVVRNILVMDLAGGSGGRWFGYIMTASSISMIVGPICGFAVRELVGYRGLFILLFLVWVAALISIAYLPETSNRSGGSRLNRSLDLVGVIKDLRSIWFIAIYGCIDRFSFYLWSPLVSAYLSEKGFSDGEVAVLYTIQNMGWFLSSYIFGIISERNAIATLALSELLTAFSALTLAIEPRPGGILPYISFTALGLSIASWIPAYNSVIYSLAYGNRIGRIYSLLYMLSTASGIPAPYIGSIIRSTTSGEAHLYLAFTLSTLNTLFLLSIYKSRFRFQST